MSRISFLDIDSEDRDQETKKTYKSALEATKEVISKSLPKQSKKFTLLGDLPKPIMASSSQMVPTPNNEYVYNNLFDQVLVLEPEILEQFPNKDPLAITNYLLPNTHFCLTDNLQKTQKYYEQILVSSKSVQITYTLGKNDEILYCKVLLINTITLKEWGQPPGRAKEFQMIKDGPVQKYNYWDYVQAWRKAFFFQNKNHTFSIFFHIGTSFSHPTPNWFRTWWTTFGPHIDYAPLEVYKAFQKFETQFIVKKEYTDSASWMIFSQLFRVPWILMTEYSIEHDKGPYKTPLLCRNYKVKWWTKTNLAYCDESAVDKFFLKNPTLSKFPLRNTPPQKDKDIFKETKAQLILKIQNCNDKNEMEKLMKQLLETKSTSDSDSDAGSLWDDTQPY